MKYLFFLFLGLMVSCNIMYKTGVYKKEGYKLKGNPLGWQSPPYMYKEKGCINIDRKEKILSQLTFYYKERTQAVDFWCTVYPLEIQRCIGLYELHYENTLSRWRSVPLLLYDDKIVLNCLKSDSLLMIAAFNDFEQRYHSFFTKKQLMYMRDYFLQGEISHYLGVRYE